MLRKPMYFRGQGRVKAAIIAADGTVGPFEWIGNASALTLRPTVQTIEHTEDYSGLGYTDFRMNFDPKLGFTFETDDYFPETLATFLLAAKQELAAESFTAREVAGPFVVGKFYAVGRAGLQVTELRGANGSTIAPANYTAHFDGTVSFSNVTGLGASIEVDGTEAAVDAIGVLSDLDIRVALKFEGLNTAAMADKEFVVDVPYAHLMPLNELPLISRTELAKFSVEGMALWDGKSDQTGPLGGLATISFKKAA